jgi:orotate phosphoribosyltransferase
MDSQKQNFIQLCLTHNVIKFGDFTLKSGRKSKYFFNAGLFYNNSALVKLGEFYADLIYNKIISKDIKFDCLYGPAYKGISLAIIAAIALQNKYNINTNIAFNRKEMKTHGEGGNIIGCDISNKKVLLLDDVITAGTATRESINLLKPYNTEIIAIIIALDRQEQANNNNYKTAAEEITAEYNIPIYNLIDFTDVQEFINQQ